MSQKILPEPGNAYFVSLDASYPGQHVPSDADHEYLSVPFEVAYGSAAADGSRLLLDYRLSGQYTYKDAPKQLPPWLEYIYEGYNAVNGAFSYEEGGWGKGRPRGATRFLIELVGPYTSEMFLSQVGPPSQHTTHVQVEALFMTTGDGGQQFSISNPEGSAIFPLLKRVRVWRAPEGKTFSFDWFWTSKVGVVETF